MVSPLEYAARIAYSSKEVLRFSYDMAVKYKDWPGVYVECGVAAGAQIIAMAAGAPNKTIYAFDSFEGIPLPSNRDNQMPGIRFLKEWEQKALPDPGKQVLESSGATVVSEVDFWINVSSAFENELKCIEHDGKKLYEVDGINIFTVKGWFEESIPKYLEAIAPAKQLGYDFPIAILRLDGDLYNSTYVCLKYLYPKVIKGGLVIIDDWALPGCQEAVYDYFDDNVLNMNFITDKNSTVAWWTK
jgi:hypothetical protein